MRYLVVAISQGFYEQIGLKKDAEIELTLTLAVNTSSKMQKVLK